MARWRAPRVVLAVVLVIGFGCTGQAEAPAPDEEIEVSRSALEGPVTAATGICPNTVLIGACDTGVAATVGDRCIQESVDRCMSESDNHGSFVSCVAGAIRPVVGKNEFGAIMRCAAHAGGHRGTSPPGTKEPPGLRPSEILARRQLHRPPPLETAADVAAFVEWVAGSAVEEREDGRAVIEKAAGNAEVVRALIGEIEATQGTDHSRALIALAILGEMKNPLGAEFLFEFATRPLPREGTLVEGEILEQTAQAMLQAKATHGLAYLRTKRGDDMVLSLLEGHPSRVVRAEAISSYLWNQGDSPDAKARVAAVIKKRLARIPNPTEADRLEYLFIDRVRRVAGEPAEIFNRKLAAYLARYPEAIPPDPAPKKGRKTSAPQSPSFDEPPPPL